MTEARISWNELARVIQKEIVPAAARGDRARTSEVASGSRTPHFDRITAALDSLIEALRAESAASESRESAYVHKTIYMGFGVAGGLCILLLLIAAAVATSITRAIAKEAEFARAVVSDGNLTDRLAIESNDEVGDLAGSLNTLVDMLHEMVSRVDVSSGELFRISRTLSDASKKVVSGAEQSNTRVSETSSAVMEINASIKEVSHRHRWSLCLCLGELLIGTGNGSQRRGSCPERGKPGTVGGRCQFFHHRDGRRSQAYQR